MKNPVNVAITGAGAQIGYALAFREASDQTLSQDQEVNLYLVKMRLFVGTLQGVVMELNDCAFRSFNRIAAKNDAKFALKEGHVGLLVGGRPRGPALECKDVRLVNSADVLGAGQVTRGV